MVWVCMAYSWWVPFAPFRAGSASEEIGFAYEYSQRKNSAARALACRSGQADGGSL